MRRRLWDRLGGLDSSLPRGEWIDWMARAVDHGARTAAIDDVVLERRLHSLNRTATAGENHNYLHVVRAQLARKRDRGTP
jgi:hypothetical protein